MPGPLNPLPLVLPSSIVNSFFVSDPNTAINNAALEFLGLAVGSFVSNYVANVTVSGRAREITPVPRTSE